jgi:hypothetical protein
MAPPPASSAAEARLDVLTRQLTGALALEQPPATAASAAGAASAAAADARAVAATCPRQMAEYLTVRFLLLVFCKQTRKPTPRL